ncbi:hypothetical protein [Salmonella enterica]|uniref:hypothetical protein n=1 Tax=Salmonella enterica TaxID=28901 RepID=UPI0014952752|nr:hypothetical protein [Salmonella enterica]
MTKSPANAGRFAVELKSRRAPTPCYLVIPGLSGIPRCGLAIARHQGALFQ